MRCLVYRTAVSAILALGATLSLSACGGAMRDPVSPNEAAPDAAIVATINLNRTAAASSAREAEARGRGHDDGAGHH